MKCRSMRYCISILFLATTLQAQSYQDGGHAEGFSIGYDVGTVANGLAYGLTLASPSFVHNVFRVTAKAHQGWIQNAITLGEKENNWFSYYLLRPGLAAGSFLYDLPIRVLGNVEVPLVITRGIDITGKWIIAGLTGSTDVEFFADYARHHAIAMTMGAQWLYNSKADGLVGKPSFGNGFIAAIGYRWYF